MKCSFVVLALVVITVAINQSNLFGDTIRASKKEGGSAWVVLISGGSGWTYYRYESDVCKAYQLAHSAGVPDDHIITLFMDDIAYHESNPFQGEIFNERYEENGTNINVYAGVVKDYTGENATKKNLMDVLYGNTTTSGSGKTLLSTEDDNVFIFFEGSGNHPPGTVGYVCLSDGSSFSASELATVLGTMTSKKMFKKLILFITAGYSGSMVYNQTIPSNVYVVTSTPPDHGSSACLKDDTVGVYLSACFSHGWFHSMDSHGLSVTFATIYNDAYRQISTFPPREYGDLSVKSSTWSAFLNNDRVQPEYQENRCYEAMYDGSGVVVSLKKRANATVWENQTSGCGRYYCDNSSGPEFEDHCNRDDEVSRICIKNKCILNEGMMESTMRVEIEIELGGGTDTKISEMVEEISELCDIDIDGEGVMIGWEYDGGGIYRLMIFLDDENKAETIVKVINSCRTNTPSSMNN